MYRKDETSRNVSKTVITHGFSSIKIENMF